LAGKGTIPSGVLWLSIAASRGVSLVSTALGALLGDFPKLPRLWGTSLEINDNHSLGFSWLSCLTWG